VEPPPVVVVDWVVFCLAPPIVVVASVVVGIGEVGDAMEIAVEVSAFVLVSPLESEPQPASPASSAAAASAGSVRLMRVLVMSAGFVPSPKEQGCPA
jgi:hypothetical protein